VQGPIPSGYTGPLVGPKQGIPGKQAIYNSFMGCT